MTTHIDKRTYTNHMRPNHLLMVCCLLKGPSCLGSSKDLVSITNGRLIQGFATKYEILWKQWSIVVFGVRYQWNRLYMCEVWTVNRVQYIEKKKPTKFWYMANSNHFFRTQMPLEWRFWFVQCQRCAVFMFTQTKVSYSWIQLILK